MDSAEISIALLPSALPPGGLTGRVAVVIDVLRATTTMIHALAAGAESVRPCQEVAEAFRLRDQLGAAHCVLGGERHGLLIEGFQLDNSPFRYTPEVVRGKSVVFTTTNGTRAIAAVGGASRILLAGFVNLGAVVAELKRDGRPVTIVCAGTDGFVTGEDVLVAGRIALDLDPGLVDRDTATSLSVAGIEALAPDDSRATTHAARFAYRHSFSDALRLKAFRDSRGGRNLIENRFDRDIERAAELDLFDLVPEWKDGVIRAARA